MCRCGSDPNTPFCDGPGCEWPDDVDDSNLAITDFLSSARFLAQAGAMTFKQYLDLCVQFDPANPADEEDYPDEEEEGADE